MSVRSVLIDVACWLAFALIVVAVVGGCFLVAMRVGVDH